MIKQLGRSLALILLLLWAGVANASFTVNASSGNFTSATSNTQTISIASGHTVCVFIFASGAGLGVGVVTDSGGHTYTVGNTATAFSNADLTGTACSIAINSSITSVTYTPTGAPVSVVGLIVWDITATGTITVSSSGATMYPNNAPATANGVTTSLTLGSTDGLILAGANDSTSTGLAVGTGFTQDVSFNSALFVGEHKATAASAAATFTAPAANDFVATAGMMLQVGGASCTHNFWKSNGTFAQPDGTTGSYWSCSTGSFSTPNCSTGSFWRQDGACAAN
jgi:hypothetical protein